MMDYDAIVVGAGPVGTAAALELLRNGVPPSRLRIVDKASEPARLAKASSLWPRTMELLANNHPRLHQRIMKECREVSAMTVYDLTQSKKLEKLAALSIGQLVPGSQFQYMYTAPQYVTEGHMRDEVTEAYGVKIEWGVEVVNFQEVAGGTHVVMKDKDGTISTVTSRYIVGCDGAHSRVRHILGLHFPGETLSDKIWLISHCVLKNDPIDQGRMPVDELYITMAKGGLCMVIPFNDGTAEVLLDLSLEEAKELLGPQLKDPSTEAIQSVIRRRVSNDVTVTRPQWLGTFRINSRQVTQYSKGRVFMCGDACHIHSPVGGQGLNYGVQDAFNLAWKLALVIRGEASPALLRCYNAERHPVGSTLVAVTETQTKGLLTWLSVQKSAPGLSSVVKNLISAADRHGVTQIMSENVGTPFFSQNTLSYCKSPIAKEHWELEPLQINIHRMLHRRQVGLTRFFRKRLQAGSRAPDVKLTSNRWLHEASLAVGADGLGASPFTILLFESREGWKDDKAWHGGQDRDLASLAWELEIIGNGLVKCFIVDSSEKAAQEAYGVWGQCLFIIRPDGYIGMRSQPASNEAVSNYLSNTLGLTNVKRALPDVEAEAESTQMRLDRVMSAVRRNNTLLASVSVLLAANLVMKYLQKKA